MSKKQEDWSIFTWIKRLFSARPKIELSEPKTPVHKLAWWRRLLNKMGIFIRYSDDSKNVRIHVAKTFFIVLGVGFLFALAGTGGMVKYSETPGFCKSCHIMQPYYDAWKDSPHKDVACVKCHYPPAEKKVILWKKFQALSQVAKFVTRTYSSKPYAEVEDSSCLRSGCHSKRLLNGGKIVTLKGIKFDHRPHLSDTRRGRQLRCVSCHSQMVMGKHVEVTYDTCYLCHFKGMGEGREMKPLGGCLGCHTLPPKTFDIGNMKYNHKDFVTKRNVACSNCHIDVLEGTGEAKQDRCFTCHNEAEKLAQMADVPALHENHVTKHNVACFHCHQEMRHGYVEQGGSRMADLGGEKSPTPEAPPKEHMATVRFECSYCHTAKHGGQMDMYTGRVSKLGVADMPSPMFQAGVDCVGCHYKETKNGNGGHNGTDFTASEEACVKCHGKEFKGIWKETQTELKTTLTVLNEKLKAAKIAAAKTGGTKEKSVQKQLADATRWYDFVKTSRGDHNIYLASELLRKTNAKLNQAGKKLEVGLADLSEDPLLNGNYCATMCHSTVGVKVPPETVKFKGKSMPHAMHTENGSCVQCHEIGAHKKIRLKKNVEKNICGDCHE